MGGEVKEMHLQGFDGGAAWGDQRALDLRADRLEALTNIAYMLRHDIGNREQMEIDLQLMDRVLAGMAEDELKARAGI